MQSRSGVHDDSDGARGSVTNGTTMKSMGGVHTSASGLTDILDHVIVDGIPLRTVISA